MFPKQDCLWHDTTGSLPGGRQVWFKRYRAISCSSSPACYSSQTVSRLSKLVEGGAREIKSLLIFIAVESQDLLCQGCPGQSETSGWLVPADVLHSQVGARRALPKTPRLHPEGRSLASPGAPASALPRLMGFGPHGSSPGASKQQRQGKGKGSHPLQSRLSHLTKNSLPAWGSPSSWWTMAGYPKAGFQGKAILKVNF